jgi:hypothetical protein
MEENNNNKSNSIDKKFVEFSELDNTIEILKNSEYSNPFLEEFNPEDVVNRGNLCDFIIDDLQKIKHQKIEKEKNKIEQFYLSKKELDYLITDNPRINIYKKDVNGNLVNINIEKKSSQNNFTNELAGLRDDELIEISISIDNKEIKELISKKDEPFDDGYYHHHNNDYDEEEDYYISNEEAEKLHKKEKMQTTLKAVQDAINELSDKEKYINPDDIFREFLQDNFKDYFLAKKIAGKSDIKYSDKILPKEKINEANEKIEVTDFHNKHTVGAQKTSVIINRNEYAEINSIEVYCKCGEKTIIRFQEQNMQSKAKEMEQGSVEIKSNTDIVVDNIEVAPIYNDEEDTEELMKYENKIAEKEIEEIERIEEEE